METAAADKAKAMSGGAAEDPALNTDMKQYIADSWGMYKQFGKRVEKFKQDSEKTPATDDPEETTLQTNLKKIDFEKEKDTDSNFKTKTFTEKSTQDLQEGKQLKSAVTEFKKTVFEGTLEILNDTSINIKDYIDTLKNRIATSTKRSDTLKAEKAAAEAELKAAERRPSDKRELRAEPTKEITPKESRTVERITLVASDCDNARRMPIMESEPLYAGPPAL
jgi:hypothetical protein